MSQRRALLRRVRLEFGLAVTASVTIDDRRWQWLTSTNLTIWFRGYVAALDEWDYIPYIPDDIFEVIDIDAAKAARMGNGDETQQKLSNEGFTKGSGSHTYINTLLGRAGKRKYEHQRHVTVLAWVSYGGEAGAPHVMLATDAAAAKKNAPDTADPDSIRIRPEWTFGVPRVKGKFGHSSEQVFEPSFILNEKGGMCSGGLEEFTRMQLLPAYPNLAPKWKLADDGTVEEGPLFFQLDAGPDRYTETSIGFRSRMWEKGLSFFSGLPNGTAANQAMDDLFGVYKTTCAENIDDIVSERIAAKSLDSSLKVGIDFCDIGRVMNGRDGDPVERRPFERAFSPAKIIASAKRLGLCPVDLRTALAHPRVRDDSIEGVRAEKVQELRASNETTVRQIEELGFNSTPLTVVCCDCTRKEQLHCSS